jgi:hypothetical protein
MVVPRRLLIGAALAICVGLLVLSFTTTGAWMSVRRLEQELAANEARISELSDELKRAHVARGSDDELKQQLQSQLQSEMGLLPIRVLREKRKSFVEVNAYDRAGNMRYSTAGYLGDGYFITVKHGVAPLKDLDHKQRTASIKVLHKGQQLEARVIDSGDATVEVHPGDWAIIKVEDPVDLPPLTVDANFAFEFADPIFRLGNDYSKGIILSTGYVGQRLANGVVTCLTDGHPGVSGGGVLDQKGNFVGIPIGRMSGDYRFSFILPLRDEMFRALATN